MEYRATTENGGEYTRSSNGHGVPTWSLWDLGNWCSASHLPSSSSSSSPSCSITMAATATVCSPFSDRRPLVPDGDHHGALLQQQYHHHMTCLKLGKRQYCRDVLDGDGVGFAVAPASSTKRERPMCGSSTFSSPAAPVAASSSVPRCQVDGCKKALVDEKEYHKRHKVCEMHSKAPKVVVLGAEQRFCQQCSRFHVISEFDESKRSCRRRLAGHNERRRKSSGHESFLRNPSLESTIAGGRSSYLTASSARALSLLSSEDMAWVSASDLSSRSSAALRELIAENRAAGIAGQLFSDRGSLQSIDGAINNSNFWLHQTQAASQPSCQHNNNGWSNYQQTGSHVTLDLMQMPSSLEILSGRGKSKEDEECCDIWKSLAGTHVV